VTRGAAAVLWSPRGAWDSWLAKLPSRVYIATKGPPPEGLSGNREGNTDPRVGGTHARESRRVGVLGQHWNQPRRDVKNAGRSLTLEPITS
jgi:hypothetical protein